MTLRSKTLVIMITVMVILFIGLYLVLYDIIRDRFEKTETEILVPQNVKRLELTLKGELESLMATAQDWGHWNDPYEFVQGNYDEFITDSISASTIATLNLNRLMYFSNSIAEDWSFWQERYPIIRYTRINEYEAFPNEVVQDLGLENMVYYNDGQQVLADLAVDASGNSVRPPSSLIENLVYFNDITRPGLNETSPDGLVGLLLLDEGPMLITSVPILTTDASGPSQGTLIMGRYIDNALLNRVAEKTQLSISVFRIDESSSFSQDIVNFSSLQNEWDVFTRPLGDDLIVAYTLMKDIHGARALIWQVLMPRPAFQQAQVSLDSMLVALVVAGISFILLSVVILEFLVLNPLTKLGKGVRRIGRGGDLSRRLRVEGNDELSHLASNINKMLQALSDSLSREKELKKREQLLTREVKALRIQIDHSKKQEQVEEITGTAYFQQLQERAKAMRERKISQV